ncbi:MAG: hypothetical protein RL722_1910 [Pseudomonadota bacterium]|jgi:hypothetical protein
MHAQLTLPWWPARHAAGSTTSRAAGPRLVEIELCAGQVFRLQPPLALELEVLEGELWLTPATSRIPSASSHSGGLAVLLARLRGVLHRLTLAGPGPESAAGTDLAGRDVTDLWLRPGQTQGLAAQQGRLMQAWTPVRLRLRPAAG